MDALEIILTRRSIREYTDRPVPRDVVRRLLLSAMQAPFAGDEPPWHFITIDDPGILSSIPAISPYRAASSPIPAAILICVDRSLLPDGPDYWVQGCAAATENILLAAHALRLGAVWTAIYPDADRMLGFANLFSLPDDVIPFALVTIGYPAVRPPPRCHRYEDRIHWNRW
ncbi:MAG: nitroreductase family protein [Methanomicrobiales archaeon]|nr:nitroreductase family protein [Methanomicrobiales archaeon]